MKFPSHRPGHHGDRTRRLAQGPGVAVDVCECGTFHLHVGQLSMRLPVEALEILHEALGQALLNNSPTTVGSHMPVAEA